MGPEARTGQLGGEGARQSWRSTRPLTLSLVIVAVLTWALCSNVSTSLRLAYRELAFIKDHPRLSYEEKMRRKVWDRGFDFAIFVRDHSPENSVILIPPQENPWIFTGNASYFAYFVYPRRLVNGPPEHSPSAIRQYLQARPEITHVVITSEGALWPDIPFGPNDEAQFEIAGWGLVALGR